MATLTVANSVMTLTCSELGIGPVQIKGFQTDDAFDTPNVKPAEVMIGVDGVKSQGYVPYLVPFKFFLQADSVSIAIMDVIKESQDAAQDVYDLGVSLSAPGLGKLWTFTDGTLTDLKPTPQGKKMMQGQNYEITFGKIISSVI